jgi:hypothetical protein
MPHERYKSCIEACVKCAEECEHCSAECLQHHEYRALAQCIEMNTECAILCWTAAPLMSRGARFSVDICRITAEACNACAAECDRHKNLEHCRRCAEACRRCADECRRVAGMGLARAA